MTQLQDFVPGQFDTAAQIRERERLGALFRPTLLEGAGAAISTEWAGAWAARQMGRRGFLPDPGFTLDEKLVKELGEGIPADYWGQFADATSLEHAQQIRRQLIDVADSYQTLAEMGWTGTALTLGAAILDPAALALGAVTGGLGGAAVYGSRLTRLQRLVRGGLVAAATEASLEAYMATQDPERSAWNVLYAGTGAFILGGGANAILGHKLDRAARGLRREIEFREATEAGLPLTEKGQAAFHRAEAAAEQSRVVTAITNKLDVPEEELAAAGVMRVGKRAPGSPMVKMSKPELRQMVADEFPELGIYSRKASDTLAISEAERVRQRIESMDLTEPDRDYARLLGKAYILDKEGDLATGYAGKLIGLRADTLDAGDVYRLDGMEFRVLSRTRDEITLEAEGIDPGSTGFGEVDQFVVPADATLPASADTFKYRGFEPDELGAMDEVDPDAMEEPAFNGHQKRVPDIIHNGSDLSFLDLPTPPRETGMIGRMRYSMAGRLMRSESGTVRRLARMLADDSLAGTREGDIANLSASEWVTLEYKFRMARFYRQAMPAFDAWANARKIGRLKRLAAREQFMEDVGRAVRREPGTYTEDPHVNAVADLMRHEHRELLRLAQRYGVKGFSDVPENATYLMRVHSQARIEKAIERFGADEVQRLIAGAIRSASENVDDAMAAKIAKGYLRNIRKLGDRTEVAKARMFSADQSDELAELLRKEMPELSDAEIEDIVYTLAPREKDSNTISRAKRRLELDETYRIDAVDQGGATTTLSIEDLLENNAESLMNLYTRQILGASGMQEVYRAMSTGADDIVENWDAVMHRLRRGAEAEGVKLSDEDLTRLDTLRRSVLGMRLGSDTKFAHALRTLRAGQYLRVMNQVGFAQIAEIGQIVSQAGFRATLQQMPAMRKILSRARTGEMSDELLRELEEVWGIGTDRLRNQVVARFDTHEALIEFGGGRLDQALQQGKRITNDISFMAPVNMMLQRMAGAAGVQKWLNYAASGRIPSKRRLAVLGLDEDMARRIIGQMKQHATTEPGALGRRIRRTNIEEWDDLDAASKFIAAMDKWSRQTIQENDVGNLSQWMTTDLGRTIIQFRTFVAVAWEKQLLFNLRMRDWETFVAWSTTMAFGGLAYSAQQYINSIGRQDRQKFLRERLAVDEIAKAAFQRAGWSSLFPSVADTLAPIAGFDRPFSYGRTTQMANDLLFGNPTIDFLNNVPSAMRGIVSPVRSDYDFSQADVNAMRTVLPFQNAIGLKNMIDALSGGLPERSR